MTATSATGVAEAVSARFWLLIPSYLLGPESWRGVSEVLEMLNQRVAVPAPAPTTPRHNDHIAPWLENILDAVPPDIDDPIVVVGHSATCPRLPLVVDHLLTLGHVVEAMILVNGRFPEDGAAPAEVDTPFMDTVDALVRPDDYLPPWHRWWGPMIEDMLPDDEARLRVLSEAKPVPRALFDQPIPAPKLPGDVGLGFLAMGEMYEPSYDRALHEGWAVRKIEGEHLHMVVDPVGVAGTLVSLVGEAAAGS